LSSSACVALVAQVLHQVRVLLPDLLLRGAPRRLLGLQLDEVERVQGDDGLLALVDQLADVEDQGQVAQREERGGGGGRQGPGGGGGVGSHGKPGTPRSG
jgi:hypothetical protein